MLERAVLVHINFTDPDRQADADELRQLVTSAGLDIVATVTASRDRPDARCFIGSGKVGELADVVKSAAADVVIFNHVLSPAQERNLEKHCQCKVIDRVRLILDIFAQRALSYEGKLQVELAQLQHLTTRLIRGWTHLERQKGGIGLRGPGETQLETDRRLIGRRIKSIRQRLERVKSQRNQGRRLRERSDVPTVALIGYTNAGKSTLFNALTGADVLAADKLFATLDPTLRRLELPDGPYAVISDTVGFIKQIPHDLIEAFHATLQEVQGADLLLHVVDINDEQRLQHTEQVNRVIEDLGAERIPQLTVFNKIDRHESISGPSVQRDNTGKADRVMVSAMTGEGLELLTRAIADRLAEGDSQHQLLLPVTASKLRSQLFAAGAIRHEEAVAEGGWILDVSMDAGKLQYLCRLSGLEHTSLQRHNCKL
jgi:GTP-binding protein HflX